MSKLITACSSFRNRTTSDKARVRESISLRAIESKFGANVIKRISWVANLASLVLHLTSSSLWTGRLCFPNACDESRAGGR